MQKDTKKLIVILSIWLICSIVFLWFCILYGLTHQATKFGDVERNFDDDGLGSESKFVIQNVNY